VTLPSSVRLEALWAIGVAPADQSDAAGEAGLAARSEVLEVGQVALWAWAGEADRADLSVDQARSAGQVRMEVS
jgi:hypothetical protein